MCLGLLVLLPKSKKGASLCLGLQTNLSREIKADEYFQPWPQAVPEQLPNSTKLKCSQKLFGCCYFRNPKEYAKQYYM
jgi:hypothetical protein